MGKPISKYKVGDTVKITRDTWHPYHNLNARVERIEWTQHNNYHYWVLVLGRANVRISLAEHLIEGLTFGKRVRRVE